MEKPRLWTREFVLITVINFLVAMNFYLLAIVAPEYALVELDASLGEAGMAASIFIAGALAARLLIGRQLARIGYKTTLLVGTLANAALSFSYLAAGSLWPFLLVRLLHGFTFGVVATAAATIAADMIPRERRGEGVGYFSLSMTLATAVGPFLAIFLGRGGDYSGIFLVGATATTAALLMAPLMRLRRIDLSEDEVREMRSRKLSSFLELRAVPIAIVTLVAYVCYASVVSFMSVYSKGIGLAEAAGYFFLVYAAVVLVSRPAIGRLFDSKGENACMYPSIVVFAAGLALFSLMTEGWMLILAAGLIGLGFGAMQSSMQTIAVKTVPPNRLGLANSTYFTFSDSGMGIGPMLVSLIIPLAGYRGMYSAMAAAAAACLLIYFVMHGRKASRSVGADDDEPARAG